jgi:K+-sensing histidine kinase KdpD
MKDDDLYARYHKLAALISVLLHDLRNPLHSATLLVEAMGTRTADVDALRGKLRGQVGKLDGLIGEASDAIKELGLEARIENIAVDDLVRSVAASAPALSGANVAFVVPASMDVRVAVDPTLLIRVVAEIAATIFDRRAKREGTDHASIPLLVDRPDASNVRLLVGDWGLAPDDSAVKAPFAITGGGIRLALARVLSQVAGATLRFEQSPEGKIRYALYLRPAD